MIVLVTGGFDPLHSGHIEYLKSAKQLGRTLIVGLNSDQWLKKKKGKAFLNWEERNIILSHLNMVDKVITFDDLDGTSNQAISKILSEFPGEKIIYANGGDRNQENTPEYKVYGKNRLVDFKFGIGGNKINSSSWILKEWNKGYVDQSI